MRRFAEPTRTQRSKFALVTAAAGHVEFVNHAAFVHVRDFHMQREIRPTRSEISEEETAERAAAIDRDEVSFDQPTDSRRLVIPKDARRRDAFQFLFQILRE